MPNKPTWRPSELLTAELPAAVRLAVDRDRQATARTWGMFGMATATWEIVPSITAAAGEIGDGTFHAVLVVEGLRTTDHRAISRGALAWRELPIPMMAQFQNEGGHWGSFLVGAIESVAREGDNITATGRWDLGTPAEGIPAYGQEAARLAAAQLLRWVSVDLEVLASELVEIGTPPWVDDWFWSNRDAVTASGEMEYDWYEEITDGRIMGATMVAFPAFPQAVIAPSGMALPVVPPMGEAAMVDRSGLMACGSLAAPPAEWFAAPPVSGPTPVTISDDGRVYAHVAAWDTCHTGFVDACVCPPTSQTGYAHATTGGTVVCADGSTVRVGHLTMATGHAGLNLDHRAAASHYDDTGAAWADVVYGEDEFGIWCAGRVRPGVTEEQVVLARASALSGDWRDIGGNLEMVATLSVNVPGFPITAAGTRRTLALTASGSRFALVAAGRIDRDPMAPIKQAMQVLADRLSVVERVQKPLVGLSLERLRADVSRV